MYLLRSRCCKVVCEYFSPGPATRQEPLHGASSSLLNFASALIRECLSTDPPVASQSQFAYLLRSWASLASLEKQMTSEIL